jgi:hypothetical protein
VHSIKGSVEKPVDRFPAELIEAGEEILRSEIQELI